MIHGMRTDLAAAGNRHVALGHPQLGRLTKAFGTLLIVLLGGCRHPAQEPVTLTFLDPEWSHDLTARNVLPDERLLEFTRQTGIRVKHLPTPEPTLDQLDMAREVLGEGASSSDVLGIDVIWPGTLSQDLIDLKPYFATELSSVGPDVIASYSVKGKLVAMPFHADIGVLFYRRDLLQEYGYGAPPTTWDELEKMATRIQQGERAKGQKNFWGFIWPGAAGEGLTCNALEWQAAEGGGSIIRWYGTAIDIEDRKRAEQALLKSEEWWRSIFENSAIGVALTDLNGRFLATNHVYQTMVGHTEGELRAVGFLELTHEDYREANWALITELLEGKRQQFQIEKKYLRKDGSSIWVSNNVSTDDSTQKITALNLKGIAACRPQFPSCQRDTGTWLRGNIDRMLR